MELRNMEFGPFKMEWCRNPQLALKRGYLLQMNHLIYKNVFHALSMQLFPKHLNYIFVSCQFSAWHNVLTSLHIVLLAMDKLLGASRVGGRSLHVHNIIYLSVKNHALSLVVHIFFLLFECFAFVLLYLLVLLEQNSCFLDNLVSMFFLDWTSFFPFIGLLSLA